MTHAMNTIPTNVKVSRFDKVSDVATISGWTQGFSSQVLNAVKEFKCMPVLNALPISHILKYLGVTYGVLRMAMNRYPQLLNSDEFWKVSRDQVLNAAKLDGAQLSTSSTGVVTAIQFSNGVQWVLGKVGFRNSHDGVWVFTPRAIAKLAVMLVAVTQIGVEVHNMITEHKRYEQIINQGLYDPLDKRYLEARAKGYIQGIARLEGSPISIPGSALAVKVSQSVNRTVLH